ncbi:acetate--CoA ligase family protein [Variovorax sp. PBL-E5]|uniref:acetate--CoA ligase family protein n=1 Tax=Variovorax sp. PBL-E5 TaxID=434014 RepID=UPI0013177621|nr:acetate--CoA ligase family protein [Variovorax sp. PBL-E5]VTU45205.1 succinyl-CoA synthetase subunit alpha [Variovorax sp. PBL-E5]
MHPLHPLFFPSSVAIIGASSDPERIGGRPLRFLVEAGFAGAMYPVNRSGAAEIQGLPAYASLADVPGPVDHAIVAVPVSGVEAALQDCALKGVRVVQVFTAGFAEANAAGAELQARLVGICRESGMRMVGPNALGLLNPSANFYATFSTALNGLRPKPGVIGMATQSGAFGSAAYGMATLRGIGLSRVIATGNEADVDVAECIDYLVDDADTRVICAALEACKDGARLRAALCKAAQAGKPVVIMKIGRTEVGAAAAATHTGSLAGNDAIYDAVFAECGAHRASSIEEMLDIAHLCAVCGHLPANEQIGIMTGSGGIGILMADDATDLGLTLPPLTAQSEQALRELLPFAVPANPYDTTAQVTSVPDGVPRTLEAMLLPGSPFGSLFAYLAHVGLSPTRFAATEQHLIELRAKHPQQPLVLVMLSDPSVTQRLEAAGVAVFADPSRAVRAVGGAARMARLRRQLRRLVAPTAVAEALPPAATEAEAKAILGAAGIPVLPEQICNSAEAAARAADGMGYPVVAKIVSADIPHKTEVGGVLVDLPDRPSVLAAYDTLMSRAAERAPQARIDGVLIAPMVKGGVETIIGIHMDPVFGPMVMFGLGGTAVELFKDVAFASAPLSPAQANSLVNAVRSSALLKGWRGGPAFDTAALADALSRLSEFAVRHADQLAGIDINPFVVKPQGAVCLDALISTRQAAVFSH